MATPSGTTAGAARKTAKQRKARARTAAKAGSDGKSLDDTALRSLSKDEVSRMSIDAWEPSLLRHMLEAQDKLRRR
ncbi:MAG TPA: hypothetical protein VF339_20270 [Gammaproteobacteria bacterium]